ncbi:MAG: GNAT family N-acetyltransferase [Candidatus Thorarchaeota archaeon]|nr:GNAT family N-acetyltransferase [Candidatus Thorarchaeota archaeon]
MSDKEDILEISRNTWEGHDYLPQYFDQWLSDEKCHTLAIEENGRVAALANLKIIDDGKTGWMEGLRVHPTYRRKGYASIITDKLVQMATDIGVKQIRYTTATVNESSLHLASKAGMKRLFDLGVYWHGGIETVSWTKASTNIEKINPDEEFSLIKESNLFPNNILILDWKALDVTKRAFEELVNEVWVHRTSDGFESISVASIRHELNRTLWSFTIYTEKDEHFLEHLSHHIKRTRENKLDKFTMMYPTKFKELLYNFDWVNQEDKEIGITLLEKVL